jgi:hypothetical protein
MTRLDWRRARERDLVRDRGAIPIADERTKRKGITNDQAKTLAGLQRKLGMPYSGSGMSQEEAERAIRQLRHTEQRNAHRRALGLPERRAKR